MVQQQSDATPAPETHHSLHKNNAARSTRGTSFPARRSGRRQTKRTGQESLAYTRDRSLGDEKASGQQVAGMPIFASPGPPLLNGKYKDMPSADGVQDVKAFLSASLTPSRQSNNRDEDAIGQFSAWLETPVATRIVPKEDGSRAAVVTAEMPGNGQETTLEFLLEAQVAENHDETPVVAATNPQVSHGGLSMQSSARRPSDAATERGAGQGFPSLGIVDRPSWSPVRHDGATDRYGGPSDVAFSGLDLLLPTSLPPTNARLAHMRQQRVYAASDAIVLSRSTQAELDVTLGQQILSRKAMSAPPGPLPHGVQSPGSGSTARIPQTVHTGTPTSPLAPACQETIVDLQQTLDIVAPLADVYKDLRQEVEETRMIIRMAAQRAAKLTERSRKLHQLRLALEQFLSSPTAVHSSGTETCHAQAETDGGSADIPSVRDEEKDDGIEGIQETKETVSTQLVASSDLLARTEGRDGGRTINAKTIKRTTDDMSSEGSPRKRVRRARLVSS
ncbi:hypothetical protein C8Q73DRAFT_161341 [Cubamyces lactineus]|nr:hypothetical protein C8Q73DRAFT_161341 [Cubamyces lactineus]